MLRCQRRGNPRGALQTTFPGPRESGAEEGLLRNEYVAVTPNFSGSTMSVVIVSSPSCEKVAADTRLFKATFDDFRAYEG